MLIGSDEIILKTIRWSPSRLSKHENKRQLTCRLLLFITTLQNASSAMIVGIWYCWCFLLDLTSSVMISLPVYLSQLLDRTIAAVCVPSQGQVSRDWMGEQRSMWAFFSETWKSRNFKDEKRTSKMKKVMGAFENFIHPILPDTRTGGSSWQVAPVAEPWERPLAVPQRVSTPEVSAYYSPCLSQGVRSGECEVGYYIHHFYIRSFQVYASNQKNPVNSRNTVVQE